MSSTVSCGWVKPVLGPLPSSQALLLTPPKGSCSTSHQQLIMDYPSTCGPTEANQTILMILWPKAFLLLSLWICVIKDQISQPKQNQIVYFQWFLCWKRCDCTDLLTGLSQSLWHEINRRHCCSVPTCKSICDRQLQSCHPKVTVMGNEAVHKPRDEGQMGTELTLAHDTSTFKAQGPHSIALSWGLSLLCLMELPQAAGETLTFCHSRHNRARYYRQKVMHI